MKICNYITYIFIIIFILQTINLHAYQETFQNTEKSSETFDFSKLNTISNTIENQFDEKSKSKKIHSPKTKIKTKRFRIHRHV